MLERNVGGNMCLCFVVSGLCLVSGCLLSLWSSFLRQDDNFGGRLERNVVIENWSRMLEQKVGGDMCL
jgi:hypothetical protein